MSGRPAFRDDLTANLEYAMASLGKDMTARSSAGPTPELRRRRTMWRNRPCGPALTPVRPRIIAWRSTLTVSACYPDASSTTKDALRDLIRAVKAVADGGAVRWAIDLNSGGAALLITPLLDDDQELLYIPGRVVHHASGAYRGDGKTVLLTALSAPPDEVWALGG